MALADSLADTHRSSQLTLESVADSLKGGPTPSNALFSRSSKKAKGRKSKAREIVEDVKSTELETISAGSGGADEQDPVLDLADQLLAQLDAGAEPDKTIDSLPTPAGSSMPSSASASIRSDKTAHSPSGHHRSGSLSKKLHDLGEGLAHSLSPPHANGSQPRKISKGQARKEKRAAEEEALREQARQEVANQPDPAEQERLAFERICRDNKLELVEMPPDGHCLFSAVADQLNLLHPREDQKAYGYHDTRHAAAEYLRRHPDDFMPYLTVEDVGETGDDVLSEDKYAKYCEQIEQTGEWGGQTEILALSHSFSMPIEVYEANGPVVKNGESYASSGPWARISYHQASYGLGQHYNSLHPASSKSQAIPIPSNPFDNGAAIV